MDNAPVSMLGTIHNIHMDEILSSVLVAVLATPVRTPLMLEQYPMEILQLRSKFPNH
jgi:hypothetical protein